MKVLVDPIQIGDRMSEEAEAFARRLRALRLKPLTEPLPINPGTAITLSVDLAIARRHRGVCPSCRMRRVLFAIEVRGNAFGGSEPRCAADWGIR